MLKLTERMKTGVLVEQQAKTFLEQKGLVVVRQNFRCKMGEIDLIMNHQGVLVFIEVRFRSDQDYGGAIASITPQKRRKIERVAYYYLSQFAVVPPCRFDVVLATQGGELEWIPGAWSIK
jgi:putative endonuclease